MGFLDTALQIIGGTLGLAGGPVGAAAGAGLGSAIAGLFDGDDVSPTTAAVSTLALGPLVGPAVAGGVAAARMKNMVITRIQTINPAGQVIKEVIRRGRPFLMATDFNTAKKVFKLATKAHAKLPRRSQKQSLASQITEAVKRAALEQVQNGNGHNGAIQLTAPLTQG